MCGIVGYVGTRKATAIILEGLKRLEYRGYDSAGLAIAENGGLTVVRKVGRVEELAKAASRLPLNGTVGLGHTRWATHGGVTEANAHPQLSSDGKFALIHNGVIENYSQIKTFLARQELHVQVRDRHRGPVQPDRLPLREAAPGRQRGEPLPRKRAQGPAPR